MRGCGPHYRRGLTHGGHLASNLGTVEITVALHRVFDTGRDRVVFDVGHQCYSHKILTGRDTAMDTLRTFGGMAGYPSHRKARMMPLSRDMPPTLFLWRWEWPEPGAREGRTTT